MFSSTVRLAKILVSWKVRPMPEGEDLVRGDVGDLPVGQVHLSGVRLLVPGDDVEQGGLARSVRPDQPGHRALVDLDRAGVEGLDAAEGLAHPLGPQQRAHRLGLPRGRVAASAVAARHRRRRAVGTAGAAPGPQPPDPLAAGRDDAARQEQDDQQEQRAEQDLAEVPVGEPDGEVELARLDDERAEDRAGDGAEAAEERHQHDGQVEQRVEARLRQDLGDVEEPHPADQPGDRRGQHERGQLDPHGLHAEARGPGPRRP